MTSKIKFAPAVWNAYISLIRLHAGRMCRRSCRYYTASPTLFLILRRLERIRTAEKCAVRQTRSLALLNLTNLRIIHIKHLYRLKTGYRIKHKPSAWFLITISTLKISLSTTGDRYRLIQAIHMFLLTLKLKFFVMFVVLIAVNMRVTILHYLTTYSLWFN